MVSDIQNQVQIDLVAIDPTDVVDLWTTENPRCS